MRGFCRNLKLTKGPLTRNSAQSGHISASPHRAEVKRSTSYGIRERRDLLPAMHNQGYEDRIADGSPPARDDFGGATILQFVR